MSNTLFSVCGFNVDIVCQNAALQKSRCRSLTSQPEVTADSAIAISVLKSEDKQCSVLKGCSVQLFNPGMSTGRLTNLHWDDLTPLSLCLSLFF